MSLGCRRGGATLREIELYMTAPIETEAGGASLPPRTGDDCGTALAKGVNDLLNTSRIEAGESLKPNYTKFGQVTQGTDVVDSIGALGTATQEPSKAVLIDSVTIVETPAD